MEIVRFYETIVRDQESGLTASIMVIPSGYLPNGYDPENPRETFRVLELEPVRRIRSGQLIPALASVLSPKRWTNVIPDKEADLGWSTQLSREELTFAEFLAFSDHVPFESSPLSGESIGGLVAQATGVGLGAFTGFVLAAGTPFVLIAVPGGMILFGAAAGVARGLEEGLRDVVRHHVTEKLQPKKKKGRHR